MRPLLLAVSLAALSATAALAADDVMAPYYGNTIVATGGTVETHLHYNADHTFTMTAGIFRSFKGTWKIDGGNVCRTFESPPPGAPNPLCVPFEPHKLGDSWTVTMGDQSRTLKLVPGVQ
jgi:hypothetical protein